jgi:hypothetical protein
MRFPTIMLIAVSVAALHPMSQQPPHVLRIQNEQGISMRLERRSSIKQKRLRQAQTSIPQQNNDNLEYVGVVYMGENNERINVVWDTGSDWLVIASASDCEDCEVGDGYDYTDEESFIPVQNSNDDITYGSAYVSGYKAYDLVCTTKDPNSCAEMKWFVMTYGYGLDGIDGIAGMSTGLGPYADGPLIV